MNYSDALQWLYGTQLHGIKLGLENIRRLLSAMSVSEKSARILHVAGTNGKGSVCALLDSICRKEGIRTGLFTSPHLVSFRERIRVNGEMISESAAAAGLTKIRALTADWNPHPTFFEITTALALDYFQRENVDVIVLETGMGGRLDATNCVAPAASIIMPIGLDHTAWLGNSLTAIASEKAGIIKPGVPVISAPQPDEAARVLEKIAQEKSARLIVVSEPAQKPVALAGSHQKLNATVAISALRAAGITVSERAINDGLRNVIWPARFQQIGERAILDGAHNPDAAERLAKTWREEFGDEKATLIFGALRDKDIAGVLHPLTAIVRHVVLTPVPSPRAADAKALAEILKKIAPQLSHESAPNFSAAWHLAQKQNGRILVAGSLFLAGEALAYFGSEKQEKSAQ